MIERTELLRSFVDATEWKNAVWQPLAGDASRRRYTRLVNINTRQSAMLMDAPPEYGEDVRPFLHVGSYLGDLGLSAPKTYASDETNGFLVIEDLGDTLFEQVCNSDPSLEWPLYKTAVEVLAQIVHATPIEKVPDYADQMTDLALSCYRWYADALTNHRTGGVLEACKAEMEPLVASMGSGHSTILRDFHAQNLIWLPGRTGLKRVGLLDYQDAMLGHAPYDLVSLLKDARRDVSTNV
ncbi:MAG: phosphotransferase, partial [Celeribacter marinus]